MRKSDFNPNIHNRQSTRLKGYDYSKNGLYFITIITLDRMCLFGSIDKNEDTTQKMVLSEGGQIVHKFWFAIPEYFPNVLLHEFVVMPNHLHGIIELSNQNQEKSVSQTNQYQKIIPNSIGAIVRGFKVGVTKWYKENLNQIYVWHRNYHDVIIKSETDYIKISNYILNNPSNWKEDRFYLE